MNAMDSAISPRAWTRIAAAPLATVTVLLFAVLIAPSQAAAWVPADPVIAPGVTVGGVPVEGLDRHTAIAAVERAYRGQRLEIRIGKRTFSEWPRKLGQTVYARRAVDAAWKIGRGSTPAPTSTDVYLKVEIPSRPVGAWVAGIAQVVDVAAVNANYRLRDGRPRIFRDRPGRTLRQKTLVSVVRAALTRPVLDAGARTRTAIARTRMFDVAHPTLTVSGLPRVIVIDKSERSLTLWSPTRRIRRFSVAVGQPAYPTPRGTYYVGTKQVNPTWTPPDSDWAEGADPIGPGSDNPLGTRWLGLDHGGIGIHGTNNPGSIGSAASHGCIRMYISEVEWLFDRVAIGTRVHVIS